VHLKKTRYKFWSPGLSLSSTITAQSTAYSMALLLTFLVRPAGNHCAHCNATQQQEKVPVSAACHHHRSTVQREHSHLAAVHGGPGPPWIPNTWSTAEACPRPQPQEKRAPQLAAPKDATPPPPCSPRWSLLCWVLPLPAVRLSIRRNASRFLWNFFFTSSQKNRQRLLCTMRVCPGRPCPSDTTAAKQGNSRRESFKKKNSRRESNATCWGRNRFHSRTEQRLVS
jgi:hypothetical protein